MVEGIPTILQYGGIGLAAIVVLLWYFYIRDQQARDIKRDEYLQGLVDRVLTSSSEYADVVREISRETILALNAVTQKLDRIGNLVRRGDSGCNGEEVDTLDG